MLRFTNSKTNKQTEKKTGHLSNQRARVLLFSLLGFQMMSRAPNAMATEAVKNLTWKCGVERTSWRCSLCRTGAILLKADGRMAFGPP